MNKISHWKFLTVCTLVFLLSGCVKDLDSPNPASVEEQEELGKSAESLSSSIAKTSEMKSIVQTYNLMLIEGRLKENFSDSLNIDESRITSEEELLSHYERIFRDASQMYSRVSLIKESYEDIYSNFDSLGEYSAEAQSEIITDAYNQALADLDIRALGACTDESCATGTAIGALSCLPSIAAAGWGYFICAAFVVAGTINCCYG